MPSQHNPHTNTDYVAYSEKVGKYKLIISLIVILALLFAASAKYIDNAGHFIDKPLDASYFEDGNPAQCKINVESCNAVACTVYNLDKYTWAGVLCHMENCPDVLVRVNLDEKDVAKLNLGDNIYVKGDITYYGTGYGYPAHISVGNNFDFKPILFKAKLCEIVKPAPEK